MMEGKKSDNINRVTVEILDQQYIVKGNENSEYIEMLAAYVDRRMRAIDQRNHSLSISKIAVLTALNLADELNKLQADYDELVKELEEEKKSRKAE
jgi:cell division protein ZapA